MKNKIFNDKEIAFPRLRSGQAHASQESNSRNDVGGFVFRSTTKIASFARKQVSLAMTLICAFALISCEVGLGESVDVAAPKLTIDYPPIGSIIREKFFVAGTCTDDKKIKEVKVNVLDNKGNSVWEEEKIATLEGNNKWRIELNTPYYKEIAGQLHDDIITREIDTTKEYNGYPFCDGEYTVTATAYDDAGHNSGVSSLALKIDNSAPLFILSKPGVTKLEIDENNAEPSHYGSSFKIEGTLYDENLENITMEVSVYDKNGKPIAYNSGTFKESEVQTAGGTSVQIARYVKDSDNPSTKELSEKYEGIYGTVTEKSAEKDYTCEIKVFDNAKIYRDLSGINGSEKAAVADVYEKDDGKGNATTNIYLNDSIYENLLSAKKGAGLSASVLNETLNKINKSTENYKNGNVAGDGKATTVGDVLEALKNGERDTHNLQTAFTLNPNANPKYSVTGFEYNFTPGTLKKASAGFTLSVMAQMGLDNVNIVPKTFKVWILSNGKNELQKDGDDGILTKMQKLSDIARGFNTLSEDDKNYATLYDDLINKIKTETGFVLLKDLSTKYKTSASTDTLTFGTELSTEILRIAQGNYYYVALTGCDQDDVEFAQDKCFAFIGQAAGTPPTITINKNSETPYSSSDEVVFSGEAAAGGSDLKSLEIALTVTDEDSTSDDKVINKGKVLVQGKYDPDTNKWINATKGLTFTYDTLKQIWTWAFSIKDVHGYSEDSTLKAETDSEKLYLYEISANLVATDDSYSSAEAKMRVDTKKPIIEFVSINPIVDGKEFYGQDDTTYVNGIITFGATISDDNLKNVRYEVKVQGKTIPSLSKTIGKKDRFTSDIIDTTALTDESEIEFVIFAIDATIDKNGNAQGNENSISSKVYNLSQYQRNANIKIKQATDKPRITFSNLDKNLTDKTQVGITNGNLFGLGSNSINVGVKDDDGIKEIKYYIDADATGKSVSGVNDSTSKDFVIDVKGMTGTHTLKVIALDTSKDAKGNARPISETIANIAFAVDNEEPKITDVKIAGRNYVKDMWAPKTFTVTGNASDDSAVGSVKFENGTNLFSGGKWSDNVSGTDGKSITRTYTATDIYGRTSETTIIYGIDTTVPVLQGDFITLNGENTQNLASLAINNYQTTTWFRTGAIVIQGEGNADETRQGLKEANADKVTITTTNGTNVTSLDVNIGEGNSFSSTLKFEDGDTEIKLVAKDKAGNLSAELKKTIHVDTKLPEITAAHHNVDVSSTITKANSIDVTASAKDATSGVSKLLIGTKANFSENDAIGTKTISGNGAVVTNEVISCDISSLDGQCNLYVRVNDNAGNASQDFALEPFSIDRTPPSVKIKNVLTKTEKTIKVSDDTNGKLTINGTASDKTALDEVSISIPNYSGTLPPVKKVGSEESLSCDWSFEIDTTKLSDNTTHTITITAKDKVGNTALDTRTIKVNQASDKPTATLNADTTITADANISIGNNLFDRTGNNNLTLTVQDDDAVKSVKVSYSPYNGSPVWTTLLDENNINTTPYSQNVALKNAGEALTEGLYKIKIEITDMLGETTFSTNSLPVFAIGIDESEPVITITTQQNGYKEENEAFNIQGSLQDGSGVVFLTRTSKNQTTAKNVPVTLKSGSTTEWEWTDSVSAVTGDNVIYTATDKYGRTRTAKFNYLVDDANPNLAISSPTEATSYLPATKTTIKSFSGTANDNGGTVHSGIEKVEYSKDGGTTWISANGTSEWSCDVNFAPATGTIQAGSKIVKFRAVDNSGRTSAVSEKTVIVDTEPPVILDAVTIKVSNQAVTADGGVYYLNATSFTISGTVNDTNFSTLKYGTQILSSASGAFNATISGLSQGSQTIEFIAEDKAEQKTTKAINVFIDTTAPTNLQVNVSPLISDTIAGSGLGQKDNYVNGIITVKASATDNDKVKSSKIEIYNGTTKIAESETFTANATNVTKTFDTTATGWTDDTEYTVKFIVTDRAKNQATSQTTEIFVCQKTDKPKITSTNTNLTLTDAAQITDGSNLFGMGANTIYVGVTDDDGLSSVQYQIDGGTWEPATITSGSASATLSIDVSQLKGQHTLKIKASDTSKALDGTTSRPVSAETDVVAFAVDSEEPKVTVTAFGVDSNTANDKAYSKDMYLPTNFTIKGTATDDSGIKSLKLKSTKINGTETDASTDTNNLVSTEAASQNWSDSSPEQEGNIELTYEVIDIYGRKSETTISYKVDSTAPQFNSAFITLNGANTTGNNSIPYASYNSLTTYFSTTNIKISGTGDTTVDSQTKGKKAVFDVNPDVIEVTVTTGQGAATHTDTSTVSYGTEGSFSTNVGLSDGTSTVRITARDVAGNSSSLSDFPFNIDSTPPTVQNPSVASSLHYNKAQKDAGTAIPVPITASDNIGLKTVVVQKQGKDAITQNISGTATDSNFSVSIPASYIEDGVNTFSVYVTDVANNMSVKEAFAITTDIGVPKIRVTSHQNNAIVNKTVHLIGIATDTSGVTATDGKIQVKTNGSTTWADAVSGAVTNFSYDANTSEWMCDFDTTKYVSTAAVTPLSVRAVLKDTAGNVLTTDKDDASSVSVTLSVNQNADRPNIRLNNILISGSSTTNDTIQGTVTDDDGIVKGLWYIAKSSLTGKDISSPLNVPSMTENHGWTKATLDSGTGEWSIKLPSGASPRQEWHFYVIDQADGTFTTAQTGLKDILLSDATQANQAGTGGVSFYFDKTAPTVKIYVQATQTSVTSSPNATSSGWIDLNNVQVASKTFGKKKLWVKAEVTEPEAMRENDPLTLEYGSYSTQAIGTPSVSGNVYSYVFTEPINLQTHPKSGQVQLTVRAYDKAENSGRATGDIVVDIDSPVVDILTPKANTENAIIGATEIRGTVMDTYSEVSSLKWCVPKTSYGSSSVPEADWKEMNNWTRGDNTWTINFSSGDKTSQDSIMYYVSQHSTYAVVEETGGIYKVPIWFKPTDAVGNAVEIKTLFVYVDPDAGKPKAQIISPENNSVTGGTITFYGSSSDIDGAVTGIVLAIRQGTGNTSSPTWGTWQEYTNNTTPGVDGTTSWKFTMPALGNTVKKLQARVRAIDNDGNTRDFKADGSDAFTIAIDNNAPKLENIKLVQFGSGITNPTDTTPAKIERKYDPGMYLSNLTVSQNGDWYLVADVTTNVANIAEISFSTMAGNDINQSWQTIKPTSTNNYKMRLKLTTSVQSGKINYQIRVENSSTQRSSSSSTIQLNIDSKSPTIYVKSGAGKEGAVVNANSDATIFRLKTQGQLISETKSATETTVVNSNGYWTFGDVLDEAESGLQAVAFWIERANSFCSPMSPVGTKKALVSNSTTSGDAYKNDDDLAVIYLSGLTRSDTTTISSASIGSNSTFIKKGGLVKIAGSYVKIANISGNTVTLATPVSTTHTTAEFVLANIIDHEVKETINASGGLENDDGDGMCETLSMLGSTYTWTASINSQNIKDGAATIHVVVIDNAGNVSRGTVKTKVENNRPRIAKVLLETDLNGDGKFNYDAASAPITFSADPRERTRDGTPFDEFYYYSCIDNNGNEQSVVTLKTGTGSSKYKVKDSLCVIPEFVGGDASDTNHHGTLNGTLKYVSAVIANTTNIPTTPMTETGANLKTLDTASTMLQKITSSGSSTIDGQITDGGIILENTVFGSNAEKILRFTFWDATEETTQGTNSQYAILNIPINVMVNDTTKPTA